MMIEADKKQIKPQATAATTADTANSYVDTPMGGVRKNNTDGVILAVTRDVVVYKGDKGNFTVPKDPKKKYVIGKKLSEAVSV